MSNHPSRNLLPSPFDLDAPPITPKSNGNFREQRFEANFVPKISRSLKFNNRALTFSAVGTNPQNATKFEKPKYNDDEEEKEGLEDWIHVIPYPIEQNKHRHRHQSQPQPRKIGLGSPIRFSKHPALFVGRRKERRGAISRTPYERPRNIRAFESQSELDEQGKFNENLNPLTAKDDREHALKMQSKIDSGNELSAIEH